MGNLAEISLRSIYRRGSHDIANEFYLPCMSRASSYSRAVGYFSSSIYMIAWSSLKEFIQNGGKMRIICSQALVPRDINALKDGYEYRTEEIDNEQLSVEIEQMFKDEYLHKPARVVASLIKMGIMDIKIAFIENKAASGYHRIFHDKVGIFKDKQDNSVVFKGSMNETWAGLSEDGNLESIDVYTSWGSERDKSSVEEETKYFDLLWNNQYSYATVIDFPNVAYEKLIARADTDRLDEDIGEIYAKKQSLENISADRGPGRRLPRPHQIGALNAWFGQNRKGIFEHATGSGKTFTALCAIRDAIKRQETPVILVPSDILLSQWYTEIQETFKDIDPQILICGSGHDEWRSNRLLGPWTRKSDRARIILAMMQTAATPKFLGSIQQGEHIFIVADEVHRIGSIQNRNILTIETGARLGLSATPRRAGDPEGTKAIIQYFGDIVQPPFTLKDAIDAKTLTSYLYYVHTLSLTEGEKERWDQITAKIKKLYAINKNSKNDKPGFDERIKYLLIDRARIVKAARNKIALAIDVLREYYEEDQRWIVYCDSQEQLYEVLANLRGSGFQKIGEYHTAMQGDREQTLKYFEMNGGILVSIRCLDEGVNIPSVSHALILASSKNHREFVQRRGRVLRKAPNKSLAFVHDTIVVPGEPIEDVPGTAILEGELARAMEFGLEAENPSSITDLQRIALHYGIEWEKLIEEGYEDDQE